jgi:hypothetical protein
LLKRLVSLPAAQRLFKQRGNAVRRQGGCEGESCKSDSSESNSSESNSRRPFQWRPQEVRRHLRHIRRFLELLSLAVHIAGGQPARGPELLSTR